MIFNFILQKNISVIIKISKKATKIYCIILKYYIDTKILNNQFTILMNITFHITEIIY